MMNYQTAENCLVTVGDVAYSYRQFGSPGEIPLVLFMGYRGTIDHWDPALINPLAARRQVLLIDNAGVGRSGGEIPTNFDQVVDNYVNIITALGYKHIDLLGYSMGSSIAQLFALKVPRMVKHLVLCAALPSYGEGVVSGSPTAFAKLKDAETEAEQRDAFVSTFFTDSKTSQAAGAKSWERIIKARRNRCSHVERDAARNQGQASAAYFDPMQAQHGSYNRLQELKMPVLVANGSNDVVIPNENSILIWQKLRDNTAQLHLFPDSGHGFLYQHADAFAALINSFLGESQSIPSHL